MVMEYTRRAPTPPRERDKTVNSTYKAFEYPRLRNRHLYHWVSTAGIDQLDSHSDPPAFVAYPYTESLTDAVEELAPAGDPVRNICRGCGDYYEIDTGNVTWFCDNCDSEDAGVGADMTGWRSAGPEGEYCYICLSPVAGRHFECHHIIPQDFFKQCAVRDDPWNTVTVHSVSCPGHGDVLSHQILDTDIDRALEKEPPKSAPARAFNLAHMTKVLFELGPEMSSAGRRRTINTLTIMHEEVS